MEPYHLGHVDGPGGHWLRRKHLVRITCSHLHVRTKKPDATEEGGGGVATSLKKEEMIMEMGMRVHRME